MSALVTRELKKATMDGVQLLDIDWSRFVESVPEGLVQEWSKDKIGEHESESSTLFSLH